VALIAPYRLTSFANREVQRAQNAWQTAAETCPPSNAGIRGLAAKRLCQLGRAGVSFTARQL
jgi:hypothetical protein